MANIEKLRKAHDKAYKAYVKAQRTYLKALDALNEAEYEAYTARFSFKLKHAKKVDKKWQT